VPSVNRSRAEEITYFDDDDLGQPIEHYSRSGTSSSEIPRMKPRAGRKEHREIIAINDSDEDEGYEAVMDSIPMINELHGELHRLRKEVQSKSVDDYLLLIDHLQLSISRKTSESDILSDETLQTLALISPTGMRLSYLM
jgi:hypothetical protein